MSPVVVPVPWHHLFGGLLAWSVFQVPGLLEPSGVRSGEDRGLSHVLHEPPLPAERRAQQHRSAGAEAGGNSAPSAYHSQRACTRQPEQPPAEGLGGAPDF